MRHKILHPLLLLAIFGIATNSALAGAKPDFPKFEDVSKGFTKVVSTADGSASLYTIWVNKKTNQMLAELPRGWNSKKYFFAITQSSGGIFAGLQGPAILVYWKRYDKKLALISPEIDTRATGEQMSKDSVSRIFTDTVLTDIPIVCMGPSGQPVIDMDNLLVSKSAAIGGRFNPLSGANRSLARITKAKAFPKNVELAFEVPIRGGKLATFHFSISELRQSPGYKPRIADERVGYFTTVHRDLGKYNDKNKWIRYINRWNIQKRDPKLKLSPPKQPLIYYIEHTVPVRYRRWIRHGILLWNSAFQKVGIDSAIEVYYQDKVTGAHMEKDPEDVRYNFIRWLNNDIGTAIGPSRPNPYTGELLDADVVLTDGWIRAYWRWYNEDMPKIGVSGMGSESLLWLEENPQWDPRILLATPENRERILVERAARRERIARGEAEFAFDPTIDEDPNLTALSGWLGDKTKLCLASQALAFNMSFGRLNLEMMMDEEGLGDKDGHGDDDQLLDGIPEWFIGPLLSDLVAHEVGHTLGLRHNFKASSVYTLAQINSKEWKGKKPYGNSVMDYNPPNFNMESGEIQGDFTMIDIGPYDHFAIEYGYGKDPKNTLKRVADPELAYLTDDDTRGPDPFARRYDFAKDPLNYAQNQMRLVNHHRDRILDKFVKDGESWSNARRGYSVTLGMQFRMISMMANWVGGAHVNRNRKGDAGDTTPIEVVSPAQQRAALQFVINNAFNDEVFGLNPDLLLHMTVDKWSDQSSGDRGDPTWEVHDRISGLQNSAITMLINPTTLTRVYDNEFRTPDDEDALTLPELMGTVADAVFTELNTKLDGDTFTNRKPMISSLRRGLQSSMTDRLIAMAVQDSRRMPRPIRTLSFDHLRTLRGQIGRVLKHAKGGQIDDYTLAHLRDLNDRIKKALESVKIMP